MMSILGSITAANATLFRRTSVARRATVIGNAIALVGVITGMVALAVGAGPRTGTNDLYHRLMLTAIGVSFEPLYVNRDRDDNVVEA